MKSYKPTKKWWSALVGGLAGIATVWIESGSFDNVEEGMVASLVLALVAAYAKRNDETPGGVPEKPVV